MPTETNDALSAAGGVLISGVLATLEVDDEPTSRGTVVITNLPAQQPNQSFSVQGTYVVSPGFTYADDSGADTPFPPGSTEPPTPAEDWAYTQSGLAAGTYTISVQDSVTGASSSVQVVVAGPAAITATLGVTEAPDTLVGRGLSAVMATLTATEASDTLFAGGNARIAGSLSVTEAADTLVARVSVGSGQLVVTEANDTLVGVGKVPIIGALTVTERADAYFPSQVPKHQRGQPGSYLKGVLPILSGGIEKFNQKQFDQLNATISNMLVLMPQTATQAPTTLLDGMKRLARSPWRPVTGQAADAWVYWDAAAQKWRYLTDTPTNT